MNSPRVFITGATGYVGSVLLQRLLKSGYRVKALVRSPARLAGSLRNHPALQVLEGCLDEIATLRQGAADADLVFHLASSLRMFERKGEPYRTNVRGTENLLTACAETGQKMRIIFTSSIEAVGPGCHRRSRLHRLSRPLTDYGKSKLEAEQIVEQYCQLYPNLSYTIIRAGNIYSRSGGMTNAIEAVLTNRGWRAVLLRHTLKDSYLSLIHLDDLADVLLLAGSSERAADKTYFAVGESLTVEKVICEVGEPDWKGELFGLLLGDAVLTLWNLGMRHLGRSDLLTYLCLSEKKGFRDYRDDNLFSDLEFMPPARFLPPHQRRFS